MKKYSSPEIAEVVASADRLMNDLLTDSKETDNTVAIEDLLLGLDENT